MRALDRRSRSDQDIAFVTPKAFFEDRLAPLLERHGVLAADGAATLAARPLGIDVDGDVRTLVPEGDTLRAVPGRVDGALLVHLDPDQFSDWVQGLLTFSGMSVSQRLRTDDTTAELSSWDMIWLALLDGWRVDSRLLDFRDRHGRPLDLHRYFTPDDDPLDVSQFVRETGFLHLRGWLDPADMAPIADEIDRALPNYRPGDGRSWWATTSDGQERCVRLQHFIEHSPSTRKILTGPEWALVRGAIGGPDRLVQGPVEGTCVEALVKAIGVVSGVSDVGWHRDCTLGRHSYTCSRAVVGISVTDGGPESGQLCVAAGSSRVAMPSHRGDDDPYLPIVALATQAGDLTVHLSCTLHRALPPVSSERKVMYANFEQPPRPGDHDGAADALRRIREMAAEPRS